MSDLLGLFFLTAVRSVEVEIIFMMLHQIFFQSTRLINQVSVNYTGDDSLAAEKSLGFFATFPGDKVVILGRIHIW